MIYKNKRRLILGISLFLLLVFYLFKNLSEDIRVFGFIFGMVIFYLVDHMFKIEFRLRHYYYMMIILAFGILLSPIYFFYSSYDKILDFCLPILSCFLIYYIVDKKNLSIQWKLWITFLFITSFLMFHEIGEYLIDQFWDLKLQGVYVWNIEGVEKFDLIQSKIDDTMMDLIFGSLGALTFILGKMGKTFYYKKFENK